MKLRKIVLMGIFSTSLFISCSSDDDVPTPEPEPGAYSEGFFVLNEGVQAAGTVTYISNDLETVENEIYQANNEDDLGMYLQSMFFYGDNAYIISNGSNVITVVDRNTFELVGKVDNGLNVPYYATVYDGRAYVTNLASFDTSTDDFVAVVDLQTLELTETIELGTAADNILADETYIYVENSSFGVGNTISVIDPALNTVIETIEVKEGLTDMDIENNFLYVLSAGGLETIDLRTRNVLSEINFPEALKGAANLDVEDGTIYFTLENKVYSMSVEASEVSEEALIEYTSNSQWGMMYGFEVENNRIYIGDAGDFTSDGFIEVYSTAGELLQQTTVVGVAPNGFYFNE